MPASPPKQRTWMPVVRHQGAGSAQLPAKSPDRRRRISAFEPACTAAALRSSRALSGSGSAYRDVPTSRKDTRGGTGSASHQWNRPIAVALLTHKPPRLGPARAYAPVAAAKVDLTFMCAISAARHSAWQDDAATCWHAQDNAGHP